MKKNTWLLLFFITTSLFSQKYELGKVTVEELQEKTHPKEPEAVAAILFKKGEVRFDYSEDTGFDMITTVKVKIKVYKKEGYTFANFSQPYYVGINSKESVFFSDAITYTIVDGKIEKTRLKQDGIFDEKINKFWNRKKITMPNVREGAIIEYEYRIKSDEIGAMQDWEFQTDIPVNHSEFSTYIPEYFGYNITQKGYLSPKISKNSKERTINYTYTEDFIPGMNTGMPQRIRTSVSFKEHQMTFIANDFPSLKDESFVNNVKNYTSSVSHELSFVQYPNQPFKSLATDWESVAKTIYESEEFGAELNKTGYFEEDVKTIVAGLNSNEEKIATLFNFVKTKVKWNNSYSYFCENGVKKAYKDGVGNVADINLMLTAALRYAGFDSNPVLVSTRSNGIALFPNRAAFNYVITSVKLDSGLVLLDATEQYSNTSVLPLRVLNWYGRLIRKDGTSENVDLIPKKISRSVVNSMIQIKLDGSVEGKIRRQEFDYNAYKYRNTNLIENYSDELEKKYPNIEISELEVSNKEVLFEPIIEKYSFKHNGLTEIVGGKIYFSPLLLFAITENPFKQETRQYPVDFVYPKQEKITLIVTIPDGFVVESMPQSIAMPFVDNLLNFKYTLSQNQNLITITAITDYNNSIILPDYYDDLKAFFAELIKRENEKIVLKKI